MRKVVLSIFMIVWIFAYNIHNCSSCHGYNPSTLDKLTSKEIKNSLIDFKSGKKIEQPMSRIAKTLTKEDIEKASQMYGNQ